MDDRPGNLLACRPGPYSRLRGSILSALIVVLPFVLLAFLGDRPGCWFATTVASEWGLLRARTHLPGS